jgi:hypothetical protein
MPKSHMLQKPFYLKISVKLTDWEEWYGFKKYAFDWLVRVHKDVEILKLFCDFGHLENLIITELAIKQSKETRVFIEVEITLKKIKVVSTKPEQEMVFSDFGPTKAKCFITFMSDQNIYTIPKGTRCFVAVEPDLEYEFITDVRNYKWGTWAKDVYGNIIWGRYNTGEIRSLKGGSKYRLPKATLLKISKEEAKARMGDEIGNQFFSNQEKGRLWIKAYECLPGYDKVVVWNKPTMVTETVAEEMIPEDVLQTKIHDSLTWVFERWG